MSRKSRARRPVDDAALLPRAGEDQRYVSRGGLNWKPRYPVANRPSGAECVDIGTSTGGLRLHAADGAACVIAVDTGYGQIGRSLRKDPRVSLRERTNARYLKPGDLGPGGISFYPWMCLLSPPRWCCPR